MSSRYVEATFTSIIPHSDHIESLKKKKKLSLVFVITWVFFYIFICVFCLFIILKKL